MSDPLPRPKAKANEPSTDAPHDEKRRQRVQATFQEALAQGEVVRQAVAAEAENLRRIARQLAGQPLERLVILGCGDSWFAGMGVRLGLEQLLGIPVEPMQALDFSLYYGQRTGPRTLVIGISSGGNTPAVMGSLRRAKSGGAITIGVSNNLGTPVTTEFDYAILVRASRKGWPTQASTATMAILLTLGLELARAGQKLPSTALEAWTQELEAIPSLMDQTLQRAQDPMQALAERLGGARFLFFCGSGPHFATAAFGAAKVKELCPIHATAIPLEEFHHYRSLKPADPLILVAPDAASHARALETAEVGRYDGGWIAALVPDGEQEIAAAAQWALSLPPVNPMVAPLVYSLPLHLFAYYLAMEKFKLGLGHTPAFAPSEARQMTAVVMVGNFNIDNVVTADGRVTRQQIGGNANYAALGAHFWTPKVGIASVIPQNYPTTWLDELTRAGFDLSGVRRAQPSVTRQEWLFYQPDGSRIDHLYAPDHGEPLTQSGARLASAEVAQLQAWVASFPPETGVSFRQFRELNPLLAEDIHRLAAPITGGHIAPNPYAMQLALAQALQAHGALISLDPALDLAGPQRDARLAALLPLVDIFLPSQRELQALYPHLTLEAAILRLAEFGAAVIGVKLGAQGSLIWDRRRDDFCHIPAYPAQVIDLTGAGDAYCGGFLAGMLATGDPWLAAGYGSVGASLIIEKPNMLAALHLAPSQARNRLRAYA